MIITFLNILNRTITSITPHSLLVIIFHIQKQWQSSTTLGAHSKMIANIPVQLRISTPSWVSPCVTCLFPFFTRLYFASRDTQFLNVSIFFRCIHVHLKFINLSCIKHKPSFCSMKSTIFNSIQLLVFLYHGWGCLE